MTNAVPFKPLSKHDVAEILGVSIRTVENWVAEGVLPAPVKLGNRVYWHPNVLYAWLDWRLSAGAAAGDAAEDAGSQHKSQPESKRRAKQAPARNAQQSLRCRTQQQLAELNA